MLFVGGMQVCGGSQVVVAGAVTGMSVANWGRLSRISVILKWPGLKSGFQCGWTLQPEKGARDSACSSGGWD